MTASRARWPMLIGTSLLALPLLVFLRHQIVYTYEIKTDETGLLMPLTNTGEGARDRQTQGMIRKPLSIQMVIIPYYRYATSYELYFKRKDEYREALQRNLNHSLVSRVHILTVDPDTTSFHFRGMHNAHKMVVSKVNSIDQMRDPFEYISQNLVGENVIFSNADIYLGGGFHLIDPDTMANQKIMYALTRRASENDCRTTSHSYKESNYQQYDAGWQKMLAGIDMCTETEYVGSHDLFLFHLNESIPEDVLKALEYPIARPGTENVLIWEFQRKLGYCVLNPCAILEGYHLHCTKLRNIHSYKTNRVDRGRCGMAPFTEKLVCTQ